MLMEVFCRSLTALIDCNEVECHSVRHHQPHCVPGMCTCLHSLICLFSTILNHFGSFAPQQFLQLGLPLTLCKQVGNAVA